MFVWNLKCIFVFVILQTALAEWTDDGKALFFGLPVSRVTPNNNPASPVHAFLKSTFLVSDSMEGENQSPIDIIIPEEMDILKTTEIDSIPFAPTEKDILKSSESITGNEFHRENLDLSVPNLLLTEATASNAQRQPLNRITLASFIRSAVAFARPLTGQRRTNLQKNLFIGSNRDPMRDMISLLEVLIGRMGNTLAKQNPIDFLNLIDNMQNAVDRIGGDGECSHIIELMDQTLVTFKEFMEMMNAVQKLGEKWSKVNISTLRNCIRKPGADSTGSTQSSEEIDSVVDP